MILAVQNKNACHSVGGILWEKQKGDYFVWCGEENHNSTLNCACIYNADAANTPQMETFTEFINRRTVFILYSRRSTQKYITL